VVSRQYEDGLEANFFVRLSYDRGVAGQAKISISTLEKALSGRRPFTLGTTIRLEEALGISLRLKKSAAAEPGSNLAPPTSAPISRPAVSWIEGSYLTLRPSFGWRKAIFAEILWDGLRPSLVWRIRTSRCPILAGRRRRSQSVRTHLFSHQLIRAISPHHRLAAHDLGQGIWYYYNPAGRTRPAAQASLGTPALVPIAAIRDIQFGHPAHC
jgi:hypothetical protein